MGLLRDESGYVMVLGKPRLFVVDKTAEDVQVPKPPARAVPETPTIRISSPHCCFYCSWCGEPLLLPNDRIGSPFGNPEARKVDVRSIATVCFQCRHIGGYSMFRACRGFDTRHKIVHVQNSGNTVLLDWLRCVESSCTARVPLFVKMEVPPGEVDVRTWLWDELTCASGHHIQPIVLDPSLELPLRTPR